MIDWLQSLKQFFINVSCHILVASLTLMALFVSYTCSQSISDGSVCKTEPSEYDWLQVYDYDTLMKNVLMTGASLSR